MEPDAAPDPAPGADLESDPVFLLHRGGKIEIRPTVHVPDDAALAVAYTPGVGRVCTAIAGDESLADLYTWRSNLVAVITDGSAVLGLGDLGPVGALPVMEGKALLFKDFGGVDAIPILLDCREVEEIVETVVRIAPSFGGINLEDISAPRCFAIEQQLQERLDIPVFHDDQHGTAVVVTAALHNAARVVDKPLSDLRVVVSGAGAAGIAVTAMLQRAGVRDVAVGDSKGIVHLGRGDLTDTKRLLAETTNQQGLTGSIADALAGADVFVGVSAGVVAEEVIATMGDRSIVFALANPDPEVHPDVAGRHAAVVATGRSDFPNQINNVLAFPGIFKGALSVGARRITEGMKQAAAEALAACVDEPSATSIIPSVFDDRVAPQVAAAVAAAARAEGVARR